MTIQFDADAGEAVALPDLDVDQGVHGENESICSESMVPFESSDLAEGDGGEFAYGPYDSLSKSEASASDDDEFAYGPYDSLSHSEAAASDDD